MCDFHVWDDDIEGYLHEPSTRDKQTTRAQKDTSKTPQTLETSVVFFVLAAMTEALAASIALKNALLYTMATLRLRIQQSLRQRA